MLAADLLSELLRNSLSAGQPIQNGTRALLHHRCRMDAGGIHEKKLKSGKAIVPRKTSLDR